MNVHLFGAHDGITVDRGVGTDALAAAAERLDKRLILIKEGDEPRQMPARRKADRGDLIFRTAESLGAFADIQHRHARFKQGRGIMKRGRHAVIEHERVESLRVKRKRHGFPFPPGNESVAAAGDHENRGAAFLYAHFTDRRMQISGQTPLFFAASFAAEIFV